MTACICRVALALVVLLGVACTRGADQAQLQSDLQKKLDQEIKPDLFEVAALQREGSAPLPASESGASRVVVYYNATLKLIKDYSFGGWDQLGPSSVAFVLGSTEKGLLGFKPENRAGDLVRAYGSAVYEQSADGWKPVAAAPPTAAAAKEYDGTAPPSQSKQLIDSLAALVNIPPPGVPPQQDEIIAEELSRASENIERRVKRREHTFTIASGPSDGEYARMTAAIIDAVKQIAPNVSLRQRFTDGSVENAWLAARGEADYAIIQSDVAAAALAGEGVFTQGGALANLRAVGGLFAEAIHVVVLPGSPIRDIGDLRGRRVDVGQPNSGTRFDAVALLAAHDLTLDDLKEARGEGLTAAVARLKRGDLDALFVTTAAPTRPLQQLAVEKGFRLLPVKTGAIERVVLARPGLTPLTLPANTYPSQKEAVATVAATALLVTNADAPQAEVQRVSDLVFTRMPQQRTGSAEVARVSAGQEFRGVTLPLHPGTASPRPEPTTGKK